MHFNISIEVGYYSNHIENENRSYTLQLQTKLTTSNNVAYVSVDFIFKLKKNTHKDYFSSYNKQWQDAQIAMVDMLAVEIPAQPRAPETVCYDIIFLI